MESLATHLKLILILFGLGSTLIACIATWVKLTEKQKIQDEKIETNAKTSTVLNNKLQSALYDSKSMPIFTPRSECDKVRVDCTKNILGSIERMSRAHQSIHLEFKNELKEIRVEIKENESLRMIGMGSINTSIAAMTQMVIDIKENNEKSIKEIKEEIKKGNGRS